MSKLSVSLAFALVCITSGTSPICPNPRICLQLLAPINERINMGLGWVFDGGRIAFTCDEESRANATACVKKTGCYLGHPVQLYEAYWNYICDHADAFISGESCLSKYAVGRIYNECNSHGGPCGWPLCLSEEISGLSGCSQAEGDLVYGLGNALLKGFKGIECGTDNPEK